MQYHSLPEQIADLLCAQGVAKKVQAPRGGLFEVTTEVAQTASIVVGLLQAPMLYRYYAEALRSLLRGSDDAIEFRMRGPNGKVEIIDVADKSDVGELAERLRDILN